MKLKLVGSTGLYKHCYFNDHLGSTRLVYNGTMQTYCVISYRPFGTPVDWGAGGEDIRFAQEVQDYSSTGLYYIFARYMDPELGRFTSADPMPGSLSVPQTLNPYVYCVNNPLGYVDPTGMYIETLFDIGCIIWDIEELWKNPSWGNLGWLLADVGCALAPIPAVGGIARMIKGADKALDAGKALDKGQDFSNFFRWMDDYPEFAKLPPKVQGSFGGWATKARLSDDLMLAHYGERLELATDKGAYLTGLFHTRTDYVVGQIAWYRQAIEKGGHCYQVPAGTTGWLGHVGPQRLGDFKYGQLNLGGGALQWYFPNSENLRWLYSWTMI